MNQNAEPFIHTSAICESKEIGRGTRIWAFTHVLLGAKIGMHCNIGEHVFVEGKAVIGDRCTVKNGIALWDLVHLENDVFLGPYVVFTNVTRPRAFLKRGVASFDKTRIKQGATIGANSTIVCGIEIGRFAFVGAGAVVTKSIPDFGLVLGVPGKLVGKVCYCGARLNTEEYCEECECALADNTFESVKSAGQKP